MNFMNGLYLHICFSKIEQKLAFKRIDAGICYVMHMDENLAELSTRLHNMTSEIFAPHLPTHVYRLTKTSMSNENLLAYAGSKIANFCSGYQTKYAHRVEDGTGRCPDNFFLYRQLDFCYQFMPSIIAAYISCPLGTLQRIDTEEKQNYTMKITANIELVYDDAICMQGKNTGEDWKFLDGTQMTYFNWNWNQPKFDSNQLRMIRNKNYVWFATADTKYCSYLCEYP